jgi:hypothetical protein
MPDAKGMLVHEGMACLLISVSGKDFHRVVTHGSIPWGHDPEKAESSVRIHHLFDLAEELSWPFRISSAQSQRGNTRKRPSDDYGFASERKVLCIIARGASLEKILLSAPGNPALIQ